MEDLTIDEMKQMLNFYKQKASDLEFQLLQSQLRINRYIKQQSVPVPAVKTTKSKS